MVLLRLTTIKSKYLRAEDLKRDKKFRMKTVTEEMFEKAARRRRSSSCWFTNDDTGLVLNKTNNRTLRGAFGDDTANWTGKIMVVFPTMTDVRGKMPRAAGANPAAEAGQAAPQQPVTSGNGASAPAGIAAAGRLPRRRCRYRRR